MLVATVALGIAVVVVGRNLAERAALSEAMQRTSAFARTVVAPLVDGSVRSDPTTAREVLDPVMAARLGDGSIVHIKLWSPTGTVLWADEPALIGSSFALGGDEVALFGTEKVISDVSDLSKPENVEEAHQAPLLEVYAGAIGADGKPLLVEAYWSAEDLQSAEATVLTRNAPLALVALLVFALAVLRLALTLARRVEQAQVDRTNLLRDALAASELERGRLAQDLHDGVIQDLAGLSYAVPAVAAQLPPELQSSRQVLDRAGAVLRRDIEALRALLTDIYPADLAHGGLSTEIETLVQRARQEGVAVEVDVDPELGALSLNVSQLVYRIVREGLRNVVRHAEATQARVEARSTGKDILVRVEDDGKGLVRQLDSRGHMGLDLLSRTLRDIGGSLQLLPRDEGGVALSASFPLSFGADDLR
jgi:signal transduction histidine kinase